MRWIAVPAAFATVLQMAFWSAPAVAQDMAQDMVAYRTVSVTSWVEEWDPASQRWVRVEDSEAVPARTTQAARYAVTTFRPRATAPIAQYGPFQVIDPTRVVMIGSTDSATPGQFDAMMRDFPDLATLEMVEAPGTTNDIANLALGRRIRAAGLATAVPAGGSVRSGAVELFLAGKTRSIAPGASFAVHAWMDNYGREPGDFATDDPANRLYLDYYTEMGMSEARARAFYAMTNSVPHQGALWLRAEEMRRWIAPGPDRPVIVAPPPVSLPPVSLPPVRLAMAPLVLPAIEPAPTIAYTNIGTMGIAGSDLASAPQGINAFLDS